LSEQLTIKSLVGKKVTANDIKYIVVDEDKENYLCIDEIYSLSYINVEAVNKNDIKTIYDEVSKEELEHIKELISEHGYNIKKYLKRSRKK
jgi:cobalamin biosynthesis protein CbiG